MWSTDYDLEKNAVYGATDEINDDELHMVMKVHGDELDTNFQ
jgi:hypothetical protein